jgi:uncharacterized protein (DUF486 family)
MLTIFLLIISNAFMVVAWYGHLKFKETPLWTVILISWAIAFFEYCFQVPANRYGHGQFTTTQLKVIQMIVTLVVFSIFVVTFMGERLAWNHFVAFLFLIAASFFVFGFDDRQSPKSGRILGQSAASGGSDLARPESAEDRTE